MKITDERISNVNAHITRPGQIAVGTVFSAKVGDVPGIFLMMYSGIVDLEYPSKTWTGGGGDYPTISDYRPLNVELRILGDQR